MDDIGDGFAVVSAEADDGHVGVIERPGILSERYRAVAVELTAVDRDVALHHAYTGANRCERVDSLLCGGDDARLEDCVVILQIGFVPAVYGPGTGGGMGVGSADDDGFIGNAGGIGYKPADGIVLVVFEYADMYCYKQRGSLAASERDGVGGEVIADALGGTGRRVAHEMSSERGSYNGASGAGKKSFGHGLSFLSQKIGSFQDRLYMFINKRAIVKTEKKIVILYSKSEKAHVNIHEP